MVTLSSGEDNSTLDAGFVPLVTPGDLIFNDFRNNGVFDPAEDNGIAGVVVNLLDAAGAVIATTTTDANGDYLFTTLAPGEYVVELAAVNFAAGGVLEHFVDSLFGFADDPQVDPDNDVNDDDVNDDDVNDDDNGFDVNLPDERRVFRNLPLSLAYNSAPTDDGDLNPTGNLRVDFGVYDPALGDLVWSDVNRNGVQDACEPGVEGVVVNLYILIDRNGDGVMEEELYRTTTTDENGDYLFAFLPPGEYVVKIATGNFTPITVIATSSPP